MRGMFTAGVLDVLMEHGLTTDGTIGVSAGAVFGCNFKSHQIGRVIRYNTEYCNDKRYASFRNLLRTGNLYSEDFCYHEVPEKLDPFDEEAFRASPMDFFVVCTDLHTGDEIEALSRSFDKMADAVQEKIADLEADVQRREDFVGAFTHELKTPMTSIIGYADMLHTMQTDPDEQREAAAAIVHEGRRLEALSRKLLALLGLNEEGVELTAVPLPALWPRLHAACPDVTLRTPAAAPTVRGDADLLLDLLCNLVQNAAKASAPDAPVLVLCAQAGDAVTLTVADRGCGIPPELIPRVTEPFYMVDKSRARRQGGSGLGLALCQRIAAAHGSALRIESEPGRGTRVSVTLPVWKEDAP